MANEVAAAIFNACHSRPGHPMPASKQFAGIIRQRYVRSQFPCGRRKALVVWCSAIWDCQASVQLSGVGETLTGDLSGIVDRESSCQLHEHTWIADKRIRVLRLRALPYKGAP